MKKFLFITLTALTMTMLSEDAHAQSNFNYINAGIGVSGWGIPLYVGADYTVADQITVGGVLSAQRKVERLGWLTGTYNWVHTIIGIGINGNYHFLDPGDEFDVYAGLTAGYYIWNTTRRGDGPDINYSGSGAGGLGIAAQVGGRYRLEQGIIIHGELGGGTVFSSARLGVSFPF